MNAAVTREYNGWPNCIFIQHAGFELVVTTDVGPRIIRLAAADGPNLFKEFPEEQGKTSGDRYMLFGGHRLWHGPEAFPRSYSLDFDPVGHHWEGQRLCLEQRVEPATGIVKSIEIECLTGTRFLLRHTLRNRNAWAVELAPWCLTLMAPGCRAFVPQEEYRPHPEWLDPARTVTLWHYSRMDDPRVRWGRHFIQLSEDNGIDQKMKFGLRNTRRWAGCWVRGFLFIKTFDYRANVQYPDMGSNCELFTMPGFLELESLGALASIAPGESVRHDEIWHLWRVAELPTEDVALHDALAPYLRELAYPAA